MNTGKYRTFSVPVEKKKKKRIDKNWQEIRKKHILQITMY